LAVVSSDADASASTPESSSAERALSNLERLETPKPKRVSRWDRPPPPHDWRWVVGGIGKVLIVTGVLMFAFVAYQLWGTGIEYAQAQKDLDDQFEELLAGTVPTPTPTPPPPATPPATTVGPATTVAGTAPVPTTTAPAAPLPTFEEGDAIARLEIPGIGLDAKVVAGVNPDDLKKGPGHYPGTPMPGQFGNSAIAGHRTTYGQPFYRLDEVAVGDEIVVTTVQGRFVYRATGSEVVAPTASHVVATENPGVATLTLTTCTPRYTARERLVVYADLDPGASDPPQPAVLDYGGEPAELAPGSSLPATTPAPGSSVESVPATTDGSPTTTGAPSTTVEDPSAGGDDTASPGVTEESADAFSHGWFSDGAAWPQVVLWGLVGAAIAVGAYLLARSVRRIWVGVLVGTLPFLVALYFFFQNVNRLLPAAL
jgi:sortase A